MYVRVYNRGHTSAIYEVNAVVQSAAWHSDVGTASLIVPYSAYSYCLPGNWLHIPFPDKRWVGVIGVPRRTDPQGHYLGITAYEPEYALEHYVTPENYAIDTTPGLAWEAILANCEDCGITATSQTYGTTWNFTNTYHRTSYLSVYRDIVDQTRQRARFGWADETLTATWYEALGDDLTDEVRLERPAIASTDQSTIVNKLYALGSGTEVTANNYGSQGGYGVREGTYSATGQLSTDLLQAAADERVAEQGLPDIHSEYVHEGAPSFEVGDTVLAPNRNGGYASARVEGIIWENNKWIVRVHGDIM